MQLECGLIQQPVMYLILYLSFGKLTFTKEDWGAQALGF